MWVGPDEKELFIGFFYNFLHLFRGACSKGNHANRAASVSLGCDAPSIEIGGRPLLPMFVQGISLSQKRTSREREPYPTFKGRGFTRGESLIARITSLKSSSMRFFRPGPGTSRNLGFKGYTSLDPLCSWKEWPNRLLHSLGRGGKASDHGGTLGTRVEARESRRDQSVKPPKLWKGRGANRSCVQQKPPCTCLWQN